MLPEQRKYARAPLTGPVKVFEWNKLVQAGADQISAGGVFLKTPTALAEGSLVTVRLMLPGLERAFTVLGKVVRTVRGNLLRPPGLGVWFVDIAQGDRESILDYVARRARGAS